MWSMSEKENIDEKKESEFRAEQEKERMEAKKKKEAELKRKEQEKNYRKISIDDNKWFKLAESSSAPTEHLKDQFTEKALGLCSLTKNFDIIEQNIRVVEIDETPTFGTEAVVKFGIAGVIECK